MRPYYLFYIVTFLFLSVEVECQMIKSKMAKQGLCPKPAVIGNPTSPCDNKCSTDNDCSGPLKCCDTGCGLQCVYGVRKGFCPSNDLSAEENKNTRPKCVSDFDCWKPAKCCDRGSSKDCLPASRDKPGRCPSVCQPKLKIPCSSDVDCPTNLKCCLNRCDIPVKVTHAVPMN